MTTIPLSGPPQPTEEDFLKVGAGTNPQSLASAIAHAVYAKNDKIVLRAVGAGAVNQAVKAVAIARGYVAPHGHDLTMRPGFQNVPGQDINPATGRHNEISAVTLQIVVG